MIASQHLDYPGALDVLEHAESATIPEMNWAQGQIDGLTAKVESNLKIMSKFGL